MNPEKARGHQSDFASTSVDVDATLRVIANLPAPEGLEERVHAALRKTPRMARVLEWPVHFRSESPWIRTAAAATIAFIVVGGGWGVYSRVQPAKVVAMPPHIMQQGGFSNAGAARTPQTVNGPVLNHPVAQTPAAAHVVQMPAKREQRGATKKPDSVQAK